MPSKKENEEMLTKLKELFDAIYDQAQNNPKFSDVLCSILQSEKAEHTTRKSPKKPPREPIIHIVEILYSSGEQGLRDELQKLTNSQLARIAADEGVKRLKEAKNTDREILISILVETGSNRLKQGETFAKKG